MKLLSRDGVRGRAEQSGVSRTVLLDLVPEAKLGDYLIVHAGYAIEILDEKDAVETLALLAEAEAKMAP